MRAFNVIDTNNFPYHPHSARPFFR